MNIRKSAAIILVNVRRNKVFLGRRSGLASFMPNTLVFPGGLIEKSDAKFPSEFCHLFGDKKTIDFAAKVSVARELFEECGLLPVVLKNNERCVLNASTSRTLLDWQTKLQHRDCTFQKLFSDNLNQFHLDLTSFYFSNWLTPFDYPRRYDNKFYVMKVDDLPIACPNRVEIEEANWYTPIEALENAEKGICILPPPQAYELTRIMRATRENNELELIADPVKICTQLINNGDKLIALLNGDQAYIGGEHSAVTPIRDNSEIKLKNDKKKPMRRITYKKKPMYSNVRVDILL